MIQRRNEPHNGVGNGDDGLAGSVVRSQLEIGHIRIAFVKIEDEIDTGTAPTVDVLGIVADNRDGCFRKRLDESVLDLVDILVLVDEEPLDAGRPGGSSSRFEEIQRFQRELIDVIHVLESRWVLDPQNLLTEGVESSTENRLGTDECLEAAFHDIGGIMRKCQEEDLTRERAAMGQKVSDTGCQGCRFA